MRVDGGSKRVARQAMVLQASSRRTRSLGRKSELETSEENRHNKAIFAIAAPPIQLMAYGLTFSLLLCFGGINPTAVVAVVVGAVAG